MADQKIYVVAPTRAEYDDYYRRTFDMAKHDRSTFYWIGKAEHVRGLSKPSGVFAGRWKAMPDIKQIVDNLQICWNFQNKALIKIREELYHQSTLTNKQNLIVTFNGIVQHPSEYAIHGDVLTLLNPSQMMVNYEVKHITGASLAQGNILGNGTLSIAIS